MSSPENTPGADDESVLGWPTGRLLSTASRLVEHAWADSLTALGLTHAGLIVLHLLDAGGRSQTELARAARVETQTMSRTLDRLEREGYVARSRHETDARRHVVVRTVTGTAAWQRAKTLETDLFPALTDLTGLRAALLEVIAASSARRW
jgi:DNA-binding MarR family transcriptional regulator